MKVCLIAPVPPFRGGIAKYCFSLAQELEKRHNLLLLSYKRQYPVLLYGRKSQIDPETDRDEIQRKFSKLSYDIDSASILSWLKTSRKIIDFKPDLVILPWWVTYWTPMYTYLLSSLKKKGIEVLFLCINIFEHEDTALKKTLTRFVLKRVDSMIVHSELEKNTALGINPKAVVIKHLLPLFEYDAPAKERHDHTLQMLFFGFIRPYKGLDTLLKAMGILRNHDIRLTIAGEFWGNKGEYLELVHGLDIGGKVDIIDRYLSDHDMSQHFSRADLIVLPYKQAKTSGIIATAYGFRKPVLATNVGGFCEIIKDNFTGKLVPPDDPQSFANGVLWFLNNRHLDFEKNISEFTSRTMSWSSLVDTIDNLHQVHLAQNN